MLDKLLSGVDIKNIYPYAKMFLYNDLKRFNKLNYKNIFDNGELPNFSFILYQSEKNGNSNIGHWVLLIDRGNSIELFDPYGEKLKNQFDEYQGSGTKSLKVEPYLEELLLELKKSGKKIIVNGFPFQKEAYGINTCGKWCVVRAFYENLKLNEFHELINKLMKEYNMPSMDHLVDFLYERIKSTI